MTTSPLNAREAGLNQTSRDNLMFRLIRAQNYPSNSGQDIVTFSAFLNDAELLAHVERYEALAC